MEKGLISLKYLLYLNTMSVLPEEDFSSILTEQEEVICYREQKLSDKKTNYSRMRHPISYSHRAEPFQKYRECLSIKEMQ